MIYKVKYIIEKSDTLPVGEGVEEIEAESEGEMFRKFTKFIGRGVFEIVDY